MSSIIPIRSINSRPNVVVFSGTLTTDTGSRVAGATITFTGTTSHGGTVPFPTVQAVTNERGDYQTSAGSRIPISIDTVTAHYAGRTALAASKSRIYSQEKDPLGSVF